MPSLQSSKRGIIFASFIGFCLSYYSYVVELHLEHDPEYKAMCDLGESVSCTRVFSSKYAKGFGFIEMIARNDSVLNQPNTVPGMVFYLLCSFISLNDSPTAAKTLLILSVISNFMSIYLAYILYFILHDLCVVCVSTYVVNFLLAVFSYSRYQQIKNISLTRTEKEKDS